MSRRRHPGATPADLEHVPRQYRPRRTRTQTFDFAAERARANRVPCPRPPRGCGVPAGTTCRNRATGLEVVNMPACLARSAAADATPEPTTDQAAPTAAEEIP